VTDSTLQSTIGKSIFCMEQEKDASGDSPQAHAGNVHIPHPTDGQDAPRSPAPLLVTQPMYAEGI
jgi:hypothetical protein